ncbi:MAG: arginine N-succinyltransferase [Alphaproteobacteria bacterium]|nr:MAG: arginine N-succinyltransferase [Alphaproteobacteria bacterium]
MRVRLVTIDDVDALVALACTVDGHMTTMPRDAAAMRERVQWSLDSVAKDVREPGNEMYLFVLEEAGEIVGLSAIFAAVGLDRPFYSYRVSRISKKAPEYDIQVSTDILHLVNDYGGAAELGTLFLRPDKRGGGRGRLLSYARLMFMACHPDRFPDRLFAEIRGATDETDGSPFWDAVGSRFFKLDYGVADRMSGRDYRFIADLMPTHPIYVDLLPDAAQAVIGKVNAGAEGAARLLRQQGLRYNGLVDIFDAGACLDARTEDIALIRDARGQTVCAGAGDVSIMAANTALQDFCVVSSRTAEVRGDGQVGLKARHLQALGLKAGDSAMVYQI